ncbi:MAG: DUF4783 domain-containing protein [Lewinellaceae bacterium]|nr:DUF4783 domain-containing protein [Lewinellaceae bacterium]
MKKLMFLLILLPTMWTGASLDDIARAISSGDAVGLGQYLDSKVEISILDQEDVYDKAQAINVLKGFFTKYPTKVFNQVHQGNSKGNDSLYCIGNLTTNGGTFRVYIYMRIDGPRYLIQELRFDKE